MGAEFLEQKEPEGLLGVGEGKERQGPSRGEDPCRECGQAGVRGVSVLTPVNVCTPQGEVARGPRGTPERPLPFCWERKQSKGWEASASAQREAMTDPSMASAFKV